MTFLDFMRACLRYWPVVLVGAVCTAAVGYVAISDKGVYFTRTELVFLAPTSTLYPNALRTQSEDVIDTAGVVAKRMTGPGRVTKYSSPTVTLVGLGVRDGWSLRLPDTGGQWASNYSTQVLVLDIVGPDADLVRERQDALIGQARAELDGMQRRARVDPVNDITATPAPESTVIYRVGGSRIRALGMTAVLGVAATAALVVLLEHRRRWRLIRSRHAVRVRDRRRGRRVVVRTRRRSDGRTGGRR